MKKCMLVGAVGLALAGVAFAAQGETTTRSVDTFKSAQKAAVGAAGSATRAEVLTQLRAGIASGKIDPRTVLFLIDENLLPGSGSAVDLSGNGAPTEGFAGLPGLIYRDPFETYSLQDFTAPPGSLNPIAGQTNPSGRAFGGTPPYFGVADDTTMIEGDNDPGTAIPVDYPPLGGGIPPIASFGTGIDNLPPYLALARRTGLGANIGAFALGMNIIHQLSVPGNIPVDYTRLKTDWYLTDKKTNQWWSPVSFTEGFVSDRMFFGGQNFGGVLGFFSDASGFLTNFVSLGVLSGNFQIGQFYAPAVNPLFPFPVNKWFEIMAVLVSTSGGGVGQAVYIKTPDSIDAGFLDPNMAAGDIVPVDDETAGWVQTYPGVVDTFDPANGFPDHTGIGIATTQFGQIAPTTGPLDLSPPLAAISLSGVQIGIGLDDVNDPDFIPDDAFIDDHILAGLLFVKPNPIPDFIIPYVDDMELYFPGVVRVQTDRIFDSVAANAIISVLQNSTLGGNQSLGHLVLNNDGLFRIENAETFPTFPQPVIGTLGADGVPFTNDAGEVSAEGEVQARIGVTSRAGRSIRFMDDSFTNNFTLTVLLGATNPRDGLSAADGRIWVRQPNVGVIANVNQTWGQLPGFDELVDGQDNLTQGNWWPASQWDTSNPPSALAAGESDFNNQFTNIPTGASPDGSDGVAVVVNSFTSVKVEVQPNPDQDPKNPFDEGLARLTVNGSIVPNPNRSDGLWLAGGPGISSVEFWSSNDRNGLGDTLHIDDVTLKGDLRVVPAGPPFVAPYTDDFELYNIAEHIGGQGDTGTPGFLNLNSLADTPADDNARKLTISTDPPAALVAGVTMVCRYTVDVVKLGGGPLFAGDTVVMNYSEIPLPFNTLLSQNINCPGAPSASTPFVLRPHNATLGTAENQTRIQTGTWSLQTFIVIPGIDPVPTVVTQFPEPYDPVANPNDIDIYSYSTTTIARWSGVGPDSLVVNDPTGGGMGQVLQIKSTFGVDGTLNNNPDFFAASSLLPQVDTTLGDFGTPSQIADLWVYLYIESLDAAGLPVNVAPRSRLQMVFDGAGANSGRITAINFGGPHVNEKQGLQGEIPPVPVIPADEISYMVASNNATFDTKFVSTGVSLVSGGMGLPPLLNKWISVHLEVRFDSTWELFIDPDLGGPAAPVLVASELARDFGLFGNGSTVNTNSLDFFHVRQGRDIGSGGEPIPADFRIRTLFNDAMVTNPRTDSHDVTAPSNADKDNDYCFYETSASPEFEINPFDPVLMVGGGPPNAQIADVGATGDFDNVRDLSGSNDVIAVVNRAYDSATNTVSGPKLFDPCPVNITTPINRVSLFDGVDPLNGILYTGRWNLLGQVGQAGVNDPQPAGGLGRIDGPARATPVSYNDFTVEPPGFTATLASRQIIVAQWGSSPADANLGVDGFGTLFPRSRWFIDVVMINTVDGPRICPDIIPDGNVNSADLALLLTQWGGPGSADLNGDGIVNAADLAILLSLWGPCL